MYMNKNMILKDTKQALWKHDIAQNLKIILKMLTYVNSLIDSQSYVTTQNIYIFLKEKKGGKRNSLEDGWNALTWSGNEQMPLPCLCLSIGIQICSC